MPVWSDGFFAVNDAGAVVARPVPGAGLEIEITRVVAAARAEGLPGALVPGIMAMGFLSSMIHRWSGSAHIETIDTVFRAPLLADEACTLSAVVTDIDTDTGLVEIDLSVKNAAQENRVFGTARVRLPTG